MPPKQRYRIWTDEEEALLIKMRTNGSEYEEISEKLSRSINAVHLRLLLIACKMLKEIDEKNIKETTIDDIVTKLKLDKIELESKYDLFKTTGSIQNNAKTGSADQTNKLLIRMIHEIHGLRQDLRKIFSRKK